MDWTLEMSMDYNGQDVMIWIPYFDGPPENEDLEAVGPWPGWSEFNVVRSVILESKGS